MNAKFLRLLLVFGLISLSLLSCKKSEDGLNNEKLILGKWKAVSESWKEYTNSTLTASGTETIDYDYFLTFRSDGTILEEELEDPTSPYVTTYDYEIEGDMLIVSDNSGYYEEFTITELTKTSLKFSSEEIHTSNGITYKSIIIMTARKAS